MKTKSSVWIGILLLAIVFLSGCQAAAASANPPSIIETDPIRPVESPFPTQSAEPTDLSTGKLTITPGIQPTNEKIQPGEPVEVARAYFKAVSEKDAETAAGMLSSFSLAVFQITRGEAASELQSQISDGLRWADFNVLGTQQFNDETVLVHVTYTIIKKTAVTPTAHVDEVAEDTTAQKNMSKSVDELWPMRLERGNWYCNWKNVIDFRTLDADAQTMSGITILPTQIIRYSDRLQLVMLVQNRTNDTVVFGQVNEILGTFYFDDQAYIADKTQWILNPLRAVPGATLELTGLFTSMPDKIEIRKWKNYDVAPWYVFQLE